MKAASYRACADSLIVARRFLVGGTGSSAGSLYSTPVRPHRCMQSIRGKDRFLYLQQQTAVGLVDVIRWVTDRTTPVFGSRLTDVGLFCRSADARTPASSSANVETEGRAMCAQAAAPPLLPVALSSRTASIYRTWATSKDGTGRRRTTRTCVVCGTAPVGRRKSAVRLCRR